ncbi:MAG: DUF4424 family protein [Acidobacteriaceae bacterium]|nr:DUF4424 family protein [Acidobacteriaceae bacterium]
MRKRLIVTVLAAGLCIAVCAHADDTAVAVAMGGLVAKREPRIAMSKEVLTIGLKQVAVQYEFRNDTDQNITTEVAFPIPSYGDGPTMDGREDARFDDFKLTIEGKPVSFQIQAKAFLGKEDVTELLRRDHIDMLSFGHMDEKNSICRDIRHLPKAEQKRLIDMGLVQQDSYSDMALWTVEKKYYWSQTFPAHSIVHIAHTYTPAIGFMQIEGKIYDTLLHHQESTLADYQKWDAGILLSLCPDSGVLKSAASNALKQPAEGGRYIGLEYVDFILTTANAWKRPIEDFTLIVEKPSKGDLVSFCWDGAVTKMDATHFVSHVKDFVPSKEVRIGFLLMQ